MQVKFVPSLLLLLMAAEVHATSLPASAAEAAATVDAFHKALHAGDTRAAAALVAEDALIFEAGGAEHDKAEYVGHHLAADAQFASGTSETIKRRSGGGVGDMAWIATESRTFGTFRGKPVDSAATETMVLRRTADGWRIVHVHWSSAR